MYRKFVEISRKLVNPIGYDIVRYDPHGTFPRHLLRVMRAIEVNCVLDVGANIGQHAEILRNAGYEDWIYSFEPVPSVYEVLSKKAERDPKWKTFPFALGNKTEKREIIEYESSTFSSFHTAADFGRARFPDATRVRRKIPVQIKRLDEIWDQLLAEIPNARVFLKMDTQGHDGAVVEGAASKIDHVLGLQSELSIKALYEGTENYLQTLDRYHKMGFELTALYPLGRSKNHTLMEMDCIMVRNP
jgi:FkbM family methyltransferase